MSQRSGIKCAYMDCGKSARSEFGLRLHRFPKDPNVARQWVYNCGNPELFNIEHANLQKKRVCENHFQNIDYNQLYNCHRRTLKRTSVPQMFIKQEKNQQEYLLEEPPLSPCIDIKERKLSSPTNHSHVEINFPLSTPSSPTDTVHFLISTTSDQQSPQYQQIRKLPTPDPLDIAPKSETLIYHSPFSKKPIHLSPGSAAHMKFLNRLEEGLVKQRKISNRQRTMISNLKKRVNSLKLQVNQYKSRNLMDLLTFPSEDSKTLVGMQILHDRSSTKPWSEEEKQFALSLYYKSSIVYRFLKDVKKITLPGLSTIKGWKTKPDNTTDSRPISSSSVDNSINDVVCMNDTS